MDAPRRKKFRYLRQTPSNRLRTILLRPLILLKFLILIGVQAVLTYAMPSISARSLRQCRYHPQVRYHPRLYRITSD